MTKQTAIDKIEILENNVVQVRQVIRAFDDDGSLIGERFNRFVLEPGDDVRAQDARVRSVCSLFWTAEVVKAYLDAKAARPQPGQLSSPLAAVKGRP